jgi:enterochelin esterase-like enzyme
LRYPEVFGKLMIFSPSLWVKPDMKINIADESLEDTKNLLYAGGDESETMIEHVKSFKTACFQANFERQGKINLSINKMGKHNETY